MSAWADRSVTPSSVRCGRDRGVHVRRRWIALVGLGALLSAQLPFAVGAAPPDWVGGRAALARLGGRLPTVAALYALSTAQLRSNLLRDQSLFVDAGGHLLYIDPPAPQAEQTPRDVVATPTATDPSGALSLHSRPGSRRVVYLDFDGQMISGTGWNGKTAGACAADAYDTDANPAAFSTAELTAIAGVWARVAEDFATMDVDVTTADPGVDAITRSSFGDTRYGTRVVITNSRTLCPNGKTLYASVCSGGCGGIAYVGVFDQAPNHAYYQPALVFQNGVGGGQKNIAEASSHEAGHTVGLSHDGTAAAGYYSGHGSWAPIMGVGYYRAITQWSKGEYAGANQLQDDFAVMRTNGALPISDDYPETAPTALDSTAPRTGVISSRSDVDVFAITLTQATTITIAAVPASTSPDLDIALTLRGSGGDIVADPPSGSTSADVAVGLSASITTTASAGTYTVRIDGVGAGSPLDTGYSDYASVGAYTVSLTAS
jgi:hypothetical protein